ncbi:MAG: type II secretion system protein [Candidatus Omnitrophica bacterium]|nr:type II secretion system protein [Candidatus Omnitrophota bacterium]
MKGITLIELAIIIVVLSIAIPPLLNLIAEVSQKSVKAEALNTATSLSQVLMEELCSKKFDERDTEDDTGNWSAVLGPDTGESARADFDDVDDFHGWSGLVDDQFPYYTASVTVGYVDEASPDTILTIPSPLPDNWTPGYKLVIVTITHSLTGDLIFKTIITPLHSL